MPRSAKQLRDDLRELILGDVLLDEAERFLYATDASLFRVLPQGVIVPRDEEDLQKLVVYAKENELSLTPRGGGTGLAGESLSSGLIVDLSRYFNRIIELDDVSIRAQSGVVAQTINDKLRPLGRKLAVDCASRASCTLGGMVANNASGSRSLKYGYMRRYVQSLRTVLSSADALTMRRIPKKGLSEALGQEERIAHELLRLATTNEELIRTCQPRTSFNRCGYLLNDLIKENHVALEKILVGSEGSLGLITEVTVQTVPIASERTVALLGYSSIQEAVETVSLILESRPSAVDLLDRRLLTVACGSEPQLKRLLHSSVQAALLIEWEGDRQGSSKTTATDILGRLTRQSRVLSEKVTTNEHEAAWLWSVRDRALPSLFATAQGAAPVAFVEDIGVPVEFLGPLIISIQMILHKYSATASLMSHAGAGIVHLRPMLDLHQTCDRDRLHAITEEIYVEVFKLGGTISAQHAVGLSRTPWVARQYGQLMDVFREVKRLFDPIGMLNPGKILGPSGDPLRLLRIRDVAEKENNPNPSPSNGSVSKNGVPVIPLPLVNWQLQWPNHVPGVVAEQCHGCGGCRAHAGHGRMCPIFRAQGAEQASPRAKANLLRELLNQDHSKRRLGSADVREIADLCVNCKMCAVECPSHVPIPKLMLEAKAQFVNENGLRWSDWVVSRTDTWARFGSAWSWLANSLLQSRWFRWSLEKTLGITRWRRLPSFAVESFLKRARRFGWTRKTEVKDRPKVVYFSDTFANYLDPDLGEAAVRVLQAAGVEVLVPPERLVSGAASLSVGHTSRARRIAQRNINTLAQLTREGYSIVCSEPTAALMLQQDYLDLLDDPGAIQVAHHTIELMTYLESLRDQGRLPKLMDHPIVGKIGHHVPCHMKALYQDRAPSSLLSGFAMLSIETMDLSCSGMAGVYGLQHAHYPTSLAAGKPMLDRFIQADLQFGSSECSACRMQMMHVARKPVLHPVQFMALAFGLMPQLGRRLGLSS